MVGVSKRWFIGAGGSALLMLPSIVQATIEPYTVLRTYRLADRVYNPQQRRVKDGLEFEDSVLKNPYVADILNAIKAAHFYRTNKTIQQSMNDVRGPSGPLDVCLTDYLYGDDGEFVRSSDGRSNQVFILSDLKNPWLAYIVSHELGHASNGDSEAVADSVAHSNIAALYSICPAVRTLSREKDPLLTYLSLLDGVLDRPSLSRYQYVSQLYNLLFDNDKQGINFRNATLEDIWKAFESSADGSFETPRISLQAAKRANPAALNRLGDVIKHATLDYARRHGQLSGQEYQSLSEKILNVPLKLTNQVASAG